MLLKNYYLPAMLLQIWAIEEFHDANALICHHATLLETLSKSTILLSI